MRDLVRVASLSLADVMAASQHIRNLRESVSPWYLGSGVARYCGGQGASYR
jgi:hypothetical protein